MNHPTPSFVAGNLSPTVREKSLTANIFANIFLLFLLLALLSHSDGWQQGPFTWGGITVSGWQIGILSLLPLLLAAGLVRQKWHGRSWLWGDQRVTLPLILLTLLSAANVVFKPGPRAGTAVLMLLLFWLIYLSALNLHPARPVWWGLVWVLAGVILVQSVVAMLQFWSQQDLHLRWLGEPPLSPARLDVSIVMNGSDRWLRGYGLNSHPNRLGWKLALLWLMVWPLARTATGKHQILLYLSLVAGLGGLLVSLSRSAWLALAAGLVIYGLAAWQGWPTLRLSRGPVRFPRLSRTAIAWLLPIAVGMLLFSLTYYPVLAGRLSRPTNLVELAPYLERSRDLHVAWELLQTHPWLGVGLAQFVPAAQELLHYAGLVHVTPLLLGVELGIGGLLCWLAVLLWPLGRRGLLSHHAPATAVWVALIPISLLQPEPTPFTMQGAVMLGLAASLWLSPTWAAKENDV